MNQSFDPSRRRTLKSLVYGALTTPLIASRSNAEGAPLVTESDPTAQALHYVEDVKRAKDAKPGSHCGNCSLYAGDSKSTQANCAVFANKQVKASGWCSAWTSM